MADTRPFISESSRERLVALRSVAIEASQSSGRVADHVRLLQEQVTRIRNAEVERQLLRTDIDELRKYGTRLRLTPLRAAGVHNVGRLLEVDASRLLAYPGLGSTSVDGLLSAAQGLRADLEAAFRLRLDPDRREPEHSAILDAVSNLGDLERRGLAFEVAAGRLPRDALYLMRRYGPIVIRLARILPKRWRERVRRDVAALEAAAAVPEVEVALQLLNEPNGESRDSDDLWRDFERNAAGVYSTLERVGALPDGRPGPGPEATGRRAGPATRGDSGQYVFRPGPPSASLRGGLRSRSSRDFRADEGALPPPRQTSARLGESGVALERIAEWSPEPSNSVTGHLPERMAAEVEAMTLTPVGLSVALRGYQAFAAKYALYRRRVLLGDEMGLGKTIMALAVITHLKGEGADRFLVVGPNNVLSNWDHEISNRTELPAFVLHGNERWRALRGWRESGGIGITTFDTLRSLGLNQSSGIDFLVVDEAHYIKNPATRRTKTMVGLLPSTERVLFMSGTPMENRLSEFQTLCKMLQPDLRLELPHSAATSSSIAFRQAAAAVYLRRNQSDVLQELPERVDIDEWVSFTDSDHERYVNLVREGGGFIPLRHAAYPRPGDSSRSAKLERLAELVDAAKEDGRKVAIYSEYLHVIESVIRVASDECGLPVFGPIRGGVSPADRLQMVQQFTDHDGPAVIVAQIQAGAVGLNIQAASVVILCEPALKPSTEEQAIARSYRMGQTRSVRVHRLLTNEGVDPLVQEMLDRKTAEFDEYVRPSAMSASSEAARDSAVSATLKDFALREAERLQNQ